MARKRKALPVDVRGIVLHEAGYKCANPVCRAILTLDVHHMIPVAEGGDDVPQNLLPLCGYCHGLHHARHIPDTSIRAWKMLIMAMNEAYDKRTVDTLLAFGKLGVIWTSGDGVLACAALIASDLVEAKMFGGVRPDQPHPSYALSLTDRGRLFLDAWKRGDQDAAVETLKPVVTPPA